ncbi:MULTISPECIES: hypothetical protein [unclassified Clostridium]|uniref:CdiA C-terminal domain-containing protein n=1 Tax=unclassified Clostridium TaxID=2614128 RepID=UPI0003150151|nr:MULTISPECIES: hypothetical protein [unclassified Clostridium]
MKNYINKSIVHFLVILMIFSLVPSKTVKADEVSGTVSTSDAVDKALDFLCKQQDTPVYQTSIEFDESYDNGYAGEVSGKVDLSKIDISSTFPSPVLMLDGSYDAGYQGTISGRASGISNYDDYKVRIYDETDIEYLIATVNLDSDGTWRTGNRTIHGTLKAYLVSKDDTIEADASNNTKIPQLSGYGVEIYSATDVPYYQCNAYLYADGTFSTRSKPQYDGDGNILSYLNSIHPGVKIARLVRNSDHKILASTEIPKYNLVRSYYVPSDDPAKKYVSSRSWIYDDALAVISFSIAGEQDRAEKILNSLKELQNSNGSLEFSYDVYSGSMQQVIRSGSMAWVGYSAVYYAKKFGDNSYIQFAESMADYLLSLKDPNTGSIKGGPDVSWYSTEHNIDSYFFFRDLGALTNNSRYIKAAQEIKQSLLKNHWNNEKMQFNQGINDEETTLDVNSWGGIFLNSIGRLDLSSYCKNVINAFKVDGKTISKSSDDSTYNMTYSLGKELSGFEPYLQTGSYADSPNVVWAEGTWGAINFLQREGQNADEYINSMLDMQSVDQNGGTVYSNLGDNDSAGIYSFHVWPAVAASGWEYITMKDPNGLWASDDKVIPTSTEGTITDVDFKNGVIPDAIANDETYQQIKNSFIYYVVGISKDNAKVLKYIFTTSPYKEDSYIENNSFTTVTPAYCFEYDTETKQIRPPSRSDSLCQQINLDDNNQGIYFTNYDLYDNAGNLFMASKISVNIKVANTGIDNVDETLNKWYNSNPQLRYGNDQGYNVNSILSFQSVLLKMSSEGVDVSQMTIEELNELFVFEMKSEVDKILSLSMAGDIITIKAGGEVIVAKGAAEAVETIMTKAKSIGITSETELSRISSNISEAIGKGSKFTKPTLPEDGVPRGVYESATGDADTIRSITRQNEAADLLAKEGYDIEMLPYKVDGNGEGLIPTANPDYKIMNNVFDCYSPSTSNVRNIWSTVQEKTLSQGRRIVLNLNDYTGSMDGLVKQFYDWPIESLDELIVIKDGKIVTLFIR